MTLTMPRLSGSSSRVWRRILLSTVIGVLVGLAARAVETALQWGIPHLIGRVARPGEAHILHFDWHLLALPALGGLLSGLVVTFVCRPDPAHGTAILIDAFHRRDGRMSLRDSALKAVMAVVVIACGGSVGKEAAIAVLAAAIGANIARVLGLTPRECRLYLVAGCAAGVGAIFQCPLGGAIFAATVLYREPDIEADSLMPSITASVVSYSTFMAFGGFGKRLLHGTEALTFAHPSELLAYGVLGCSCAGAAILFHLCLKAATRLRVRSRLPRWLAPGAAGLLVGGIACAFPQVMDAGYNFIQNALSPKWLGVGLGQAPQWTHWMLLFALVVAAKCVATALMIGTNTAGGLFGPVVFIGGAMGAATGAFLQAAFPGAFPEALREALIPVGMAGVLAAALRVPLAAVVMVMEMTGSYGLIVPLMLVSVVSYAIARRWGVYDEQAEGLEDSPAHAGAHLLGILESRTVQEVMHKDWPHVISTRTTLPQMVAMMASGTRPYFAVLEAGRKLVGIISTGDITRAAEIMGSSNLIIAVDIMTSKPRVVYPDSDLYSPLAIFRETQLEVLPVVGRQGRLFRGMLMRADIHRAVQQRFEEQRAQILREHVGVEVLMQDSELDALLSGLPQQHKGTVNRMPVPSDVVGKSLRQTEFRRLYGEVIGIHTDSGQLLTPPDPDRPLEAGDFLILVPKGG